MKTVLTFGVFDLLHWGHFELFRRAKELAGEGGRLVVAVQRDEYVTKFKDVRLVYTHEQRTKMIATLRTVDAVVPYTAVDETIPTLDFTCLVLGPDQTHAGIQRARDCCLAHGKEVVVLARTPGVSSSQLRAGRAAPAPDTPSGYRGGVRPPCEVADGRDVLVVACRVRRVFDSYFILTFESDAPSFADASEMSPRRHTRFGHRRCFRRPVGCRARRVSLSCRVKGFCHG